MPLLGLLMQANRYPKAPMMLRDRLTDAQVTYDRSQGRSIIHGRYRLKPGTIWTTLVDHSGKPLVFRDMVSAMDAADIVRMQHQKPGDSLGITS